MNSLEDQIGEHDATVRAPADWIAKAEHEYMSRRRVTWRQWVELAAIVVASACLAMVF